MKRVLMLGLMVALTPLVALRANDPDPEPRSTDQAALMRGSWELSHLEILGKKVNAGDLGGKLAVTIKFKTNSCTSTANGMTKTGTWKIDARKKPKTIDVKNKDDGQTGLGIYKLEKDQLIIAFALPGKARPKDFKDQMLPTLFFKRVKK